MLCQFQAEVKRVINKHNFIIPPQNIVDRIEYQNSVQKCCISKILFELFEFSIRSIRVVNYYYNHKEIESTK